jgi:hypothetical protein
MDERMDDIYNNVEYDDDTVIIRCLNTILEQKKNDFETYIMFEHFVNMLAKLTETSLIVRPDVIFVVEHIKYIRANETLDAIRTISQKMFKENLMIYKFLFVLCYCRAVFELKYEKQYENSMKHDPAYAVNVAIGVNPWSYLLTHQPVI